MKRQVFDWCLWAFLVGAALAICAITSIWPLLVLLWVFAATQGK